METITLDYAIKFSKVDSKVVKELYQKLNEYGLKPQTIIQIINIMPRTSDELKVILIEDCLLYTSPSPRDRG